MAIEVVERLVGEASTDAGCVEAIRELEVLKCRAEAAQAELAARLDGLVRASEEAAGVPAARRGRGVAAQVALARRESLHKGQQHLGLAMVLGELPHTAAAFAAGRVSEWRVMLLARESACLSLEDRQVVDFELAGDDDELEGRGDGELVAEARRIAYRLDPEAFVARRAKAEAERRVSLRPAPEVMSQLSGLLPVKDGVAVWATLQARAKAAIGMGDERSHSQLMADLLVEAITGRPASTAPTNSPTTDSQSEPDTKAGWCADVVLSDATLLGVSDEAGWVEGYGPVPADLARELAADATWLRRLYAEACSGALVAMESRRRLFSSGLASFLRHRDRTCRIPWCDAPIRHSDHVQPAEAGGETSALNGEGLCEAHNHAKQAPGWRQEAVQHPGGRHTVLTTAPTGHSYLSTAPPLPPPITPRPPQARVSRLEVYLTDLLERRAA